MDQKLTMLILVVVLMSMSVNISCATVDKDKEKCANDLIGLATCLPYVSGESRSPPIDCCSGLKQVLQKSPECICLLVKDRNDPSLGLTINATLALSLPSHCHAPNATISDCPALLHLAPNSPDAKVFEDFAKSGNKTSNATSSSTAPTAAAATADNKSSDAAGINRRIITAYYFLPLLFTIMSLNSLFTQL